MGLTHKMSFLSLLDPIESGFDEDSAVKWVSQHWTLSLYASAVYALLIHAGRWWMSDKPPWSLRTPMVMWNTGLAVFSSLGALTLLPSLSAALWENGITYSVCQRVVMGTAASQRNLWSFLFVLFKLIELGDTTFIVLRKTPLSFLHWYHHITVLLYCWGQYNSRASVGNWFITLNFIVHAIMYTYYAIRASGYRMTSTIMQTITALQMSQFLVGILANLLAYRHLTKGEECMVTKQVFYFGLALYGSYLLLFANFFYQRYCVKKRV